MSPLPSDQGPDGDPPGTGLSTLSCASTLAGRWSGAVSSPCSPRGPHLSLCGCWVSGSRAEKVATGVPGAAPSARLVRSGFSWNTGASLTSRTCTRTLAWPRAALGAAACRGASFCTATLRSYRSRLSKSRGCRGSRAAARQDSGPLPPIQGTQRQLRAGEASSGLSSEPLLSFCLKPRKNKNHAGQKGTKTNAKMTATHHANMCWVL